ATSPSIPSACLPLSRTSIFLRFFSRFSSATASARSIRRPSASFTNRSKISTLSTRRCAPSMSSRTPCPARSLMPLRSGSAADNSRLPIAYDRAKCLSGGQFGFLFDNPQDSISFSRFQCFDFQKMSRYPELLEPLLFYILHRANEVIANRDVSSTFKAFFIDEAWVFLRNASIRRYITEALKTWRKHNAAMILSTQSLDELKRSELLDIIVESCATKMFLANPDMDHDLYRGQFHLNDTEVDLISSLIPKQQFLLKTPELAKVANLHVDRRSYWLYTNDPYDNRRRKEAFDAYGFEKGLDVLAGALT